MKVKIIKIDIFSNWGKTTIGNVLIDFSKKRKRDFIGSDKEPISCNSWYDFFEGYTLPKNFPELFVYKKNLYGIDKSDTYTDDEKKLMIKEHFYKHNEKFKKLQKEIHLFETVERKSEPMSREPIPEQVRFSVWRRDEGKCVQCGSNKGLEFDHIIPFSKGGSSTERNLQLLCEKCNLGKSANI